MNSQNEKVERLTFMEHTLFITHLYTTLCVRPKQCRQQALLTPIYPVNEKDLKPTAKKCQRGDLSHV